MNTSSPTIFVIVGITGDLAKRKLLPAIASLMMEGKVPDRFHIVGVTRQSGIKLDDLLEMVPLRTAIAEHISILAMDLADTTAYQTLTNILATIEKQWGKQAKRLIYLSVPPTVSKGIIEHLSSSGITKDLNTKVLMEKPFGTEYDDAAALAQHVQKYILPEQLYRVDHYLAKSMVQEMMNRSPHTSKLIRIDIMASESLGIEGRTNFYEQTGALRDLVQSHLLQFVAAALYDPTSPKVLSAQRLAALQSCTVVPDSVVRGQYAGYKDEVGNPNSTTETFVSLTLHTSLPGYTDVPINLATGKALAVKKTSITFVYADGSTHEFVDRPVRPAEAYERIVCSALTNDTNMFISTEDVLACWRIVAPIQEAWKKHNDDLVTYEQGTPIDQVYTQK